MSDFGSMLVLVAMPATIAQCAVMQFTSRNFPITTDADVLRFVASNDQNRVRCIGCAPLGIGFEDLHGATHIKVYATDQHPFPDHINTQSTIYFRKTRTQGSIWVILSDELGTPIPFQDEETTLSVAKFLTEYQSIWRNKFHQGDVVLEEPPEHALSVVPGESIDGLLQRVRNAAR
jgi:hypothetical protein